MDVSGGGYILICIHVGVALLREVFTRTPSAVTRHMTHGGGVYKGKDSGANISFDGRVGIILLMTV